MVTSLELVREFKSFHPADRRFANYRNALISAFARDQLITANARPSFSHGICPLPSVTKIKDLIVTEREVHFSAS